MLDKDYLDGMTIKHISQKYQISIATIYKQLNKLGITRGISKSDKNRFHNRYKSITHDTLYNYYIIDLLTIKEISIKLNYREDIIRRLLLSYNIKLRNAKEHFAIDKNKILLKQNIKKAMSTIKIKNLVSKNSKLVWKNRNYKIHPNTLKIMQSDQYRSKMSDITKTRHQTKWHEDIKILISEGLKKCWNTNIEYRKNITKLSSILFNKIRKDEHLYQKWKNNHNIAMRDPIYRLHRSELVKKLWENNEYRLKMLHARVNMPVISTQQKTLYEILDSLHISYEPEKVIGYYSFDCYLPDYNILIEVNGDYWHSLPRAIRNDKSKSTFIEKYFPEYSLKVLWEHEFKCVNKITELLQYWTNRITLNQFDMKSLTLNNIDRDEANQFIQKYHYLGKIGNNSLRIGFKLNDLLIGVIIYGPITRKESADRLGYKSNEILELTRLCIHPCYQIKNLASFMISKSISIIKNLNKYKCLLSFADSTYNHSGTIYKASNWTFDGEIAPSYWYVDKDGYTMHKKTLWDHAQSLRMTENEFANKHGYKLKHGLYKLRFIYRL